MPPLTVTLLGTFTVQHNGRSLLPFRNKKSQALLAYLLVEPPQPQPREALMTLLWPESPLTTAQVNLRQSLYQLRRALPNLLHATRQTVQRHPDFPLQLDVTRFLSGKTAVSLDQRYEAALHYQGAFLADFFLPDSSPFEEWVTVWRSQLEQHAITLLTKLHEQLQARQQQQRLTTLQQHWQQLFPNLKTADFPPSLLTAKQIAPTFCLLDIASFGQLVAHSEQGAIALLAQYNALIQHAVQQHNGRLLQQMGDGHLVVFEDTSPLPFLQAVQTAIVAEAWPTAKPPQLTVALHHAPAADEGTTFFRVGDGYSGTAVLHLFKLFKQAAPNQIVASAAVTAAFPSAAWQPIQMSQLYRLQSDSRQTNK